jgi:uncharacterized cofD-like protein
MEQGNDIDLRTGLKVVAIGGGNGLSTLLSGLKKYVGTDEEYSINRLSAIVAVTDDGGSSGRLRDELQMLPPGDIRNCMVALSEDSLLMSRLFRHRFPGNGELGGHSFGNIFLAALTDLTGDFAEAIRLSSEILASRGHIYPATTANVRLAALLSDGTRAKGETNIAKVGPSIKRLYLEPEECQPLPAAIAAIDEADLITIGPGSLFTSILPPLLVHGVADAVAASNATRIFVSNLMTQSGETDGFSADRHLAVVGEYAPEIRFHYLVVNDKPISMSQRLAYSAEGAVQIGIDEAFPSLQSYGGEVVYANLLDDGELVRHDPRRLADAVLACIGRRSGEPVAPAGPN